MVIEYYGDPFSNIHSYQYRKPKYEKTEILCPLTSALLKTSPFCEEPAEIIPSKILLTFLINRSIVCQSNITLNTTPAEPPPRAHFTRDRIPTQNWQRSLTSSGSYIHHTENFSRGIN
jgi:hypothetical protein